MVPMGIDVTVEWDAAEGTLTVALPRPGMAVLLRLSAIR